MARAENIAAAPGIRQSASEQGDFNPIAVAKGILRTTRAGSLATIDRNTGHPFASLANVATDTDGSLLILISRLAAHTANIESDPRASVLLTVAGVKGDPLAHPRLTVLGSFVNVPREAPDAARVRRRFLSRHPKSRLYASFGDFSFWRLHVVSAHLNGGFARAADLAAGDILTRIDDVAEIVEIEESTIAQMNSDHAAVARLFATGLLAQLDGAWAVTGIDPDGIDLAHGDLIARLPFDMRVTNGHALREMLSGLAVKARAKTAPA